MTDDKVVNAIKPTPASEDWLKHGRDLLKNSPELVDDKAKTYITLASSLVTAYTGAVGLLKLIDKEIAPFGYVAIPVVFWVTSIVLLGRVLWPGYSNMDLNSPSSIKSSLELRSQRKYRQLKIAGVSSLISVISMLSVLLIGSYSLSATTATGKVQLVIPKEKQETFLGLPIPLEAGTNRTLVVSLHGEAGDYYKIQLSDGTNIQLKKELVSGIIFK